MKCLVNFIALNKLTLLLLEHLLALCSLVFTHYIHFPNEVHVRLYSLQVNIQIVNHHSERRKKGSSVPFYPCLHSRPCQNQVDTEGFLLLIIKLHFNHCLCHPRTPQTKTSSFLLLLHRKILPSEGLQGIWKRSAITLMIKIRKWSSCLRNHCPSVNTVSHSHKMRELI